MTKVKSTYTIDFDVLEAFRRHCHDRCINQSALIEQFMADTVAGNIVTASELDAINARLERVNALLAKVGLRVESLVTREKK